ncbi:MAG: hypothetical protein M1156_00265 [Candidatus Marsarchaeota archaeon]|nr:hypothetical protein [Candidatus Marsarchaeota archaeon]
MINDMEKIESELLKLQETKDKVMDLSRETVRLAGKAITKIHAGDSDSVSRLLSELKNNVKKLKTIEKGFEYNSMQAHQEYVEAYALYIMVKESRVPTMKELDTDGISYLLGLLDSVGELKRHSFDYLRKNDRKSAEKCYDLMLEIYDSTVPMRFANSLVPDFRKKQDVARAQIERLSSELLLFRL